eukprot:INCI9831.1.p1 GENE.INCI9831.1~~INCI9831.1.p1  ORF type:complete len:637 (-),score=100.81 INCI9831.1:126-2036(-)
MVPQLSVTRASWWLLLLRCWLLSSLCRSHARAAGLHGPVFADGFEEPVQDGRRMPPFVFLRPPQTFSVHWPVRDNVANLSSPMELALYSVIPDTSAGKAYLMFALTASGMHWVNDVAAQIIPATSRNGSSNKPVRDVEPFLHTPRFGNLRCLFAGADGTAVGGGDGMVKPVLVESAVFTWTRVLVGSCAMPPAFTKMLQDEASNSNKPTIRVLHEDDEAEDLTSHGRKLQKSATGKQFFATPGLRCGQAKALSSNANKQGAENRTQCAALCAALPRDDDGRLCNLWQWDELQRICSISRFYRRGVDCSNSTTVTVGTRRHVPWDALDVSRPPLQRRLIVFGGTSPVFGDGRFVDRVAQWVEYYLLNFPDAHFFVYARGGDGLGGFSDHVADSLPPSVGGVAALHPFIEAGVVTVIWLPADVDKALDQKKHAVQIRDESEVLYRAKGLSTWVGATIDFDEYIAPAHSIHSTRKAGHAISSLSSATLDFSRVSTGKSLFPMSRFLSQVPASTGQLVFRKWPAFIPDQSNALFIDTTSVAASFAHGRLGKYLVRTEAAKLLYTHFPVLAEAGWPHLFSPKSRSKLQVSDIVYEILHFREKDWTPVEEAGTAVKYMAAVDVAHTVRQRLWTRYNTVNTST